MKHTILCCLLLSPLLLWAQAGPDGRWIALPEPRDEPETPAAPLPRTFRGMSLGMDLAALKTALQEDGLFHFRGDRDVSFLPSREQNLVETTGFSFIRRAFFQLREGRVFIMAFMLDPALVDHYSVFTTLVKKYGEPDRLDPRLAVWETEDTRVALERPLTIKYVDLKVFKELIDRSEVEASGEVFLRQEFLDDL